MIRGMFIVCAAVATLALGAPTTDAGCCDPCCKPAPKCCCCPPPPVEKTWCVKDPCTCCEYKVTACVPACCAEAEPVLDGCRNGLFGRKVLTYKFECCDHCVDVVITKHGRTIVRD